jgi:hypothetical protein
LNEEIIVPEARGQKFGRWSGRLAPPVGLPSYHHPRLRSTFALSQCLDPLHHAAETIVTVTAHARRTRLVDGSEVTRLTGPRARTGRETATTTGPPHAETGTETTTADGTESTMIVNGLTARSEIGRGSETGTTSGTRGTRRTRSELIPLPPSRVPINAALQLLAVVSNDSSWQRYHVTAVGARLRTSLVMAGRVGGGGREAR